MVFEINVWSLITTMGDPRLWAALCIVFFVLRMHYRKRDGPSKNRFKWVGMFIIFVGFAAAASLGLSEALKYQFQIPRNCTPCAVDNLDTCNKYCPSDYSFPSGHSSVTFAAFAGIFFIVRRRKHAWIFLFPSLVAVSRLALGVHTIYDVVGGAAVGLFTFLVFFLVISRIKAFRRWVY